LVHYYRKSDTYKNGNSIFNYHNYRLRFLAPKSGKLTILPIYSSRSYHMGPWLATNPKEKAMQTWLYGQKGYTKAKGAWKKRLRIGGSLWYRYTDTKKCVERFLNDQPAVSNRFEQDEESLLPNAAEALFFKDIKVFPNPANEQLRIRLQQVMPIELSLYSLLGQEILHKQYDQIQFVELDIAAIPNGAYLLYLRNKYQRVGRKVVVGNAY
ncbi:MAG: T9SS type A sorting domain-containing protein, partial [Bacteroidota bacterium]